MPNSLIRKLEIASGLTDQDRAVLQSLCTSPRRIEAGRDIISQGDRPSDVHLVLEGYAHRYKLLGDGSRQIVALLVPGDFCDLHVAILGEMDHAIATLTGCTVVEIPRETIVNLIAYHPRITRALWWATLVDEGTLREWVTNLGQREAAQRMSHLFCELLLRLQSIGLADTNSFDLPFTQIELADLLGMTSVHVNRSIRLLREKELIVLDRRRLTIPDVRLLRAYCDFDPTYLHLQSSELAREG